MRSSKEEQIDPVKKMLWQSIRIFKKGGFSVPELLMTAPGATFRGANRFILDLERHGVIVKAGGIAVEKRHQRFRLVPERETVAYPTLCSKCGKTLYRRCFFSASDENRETEKKTERQGKAKREPTLPQKPRMPAAVDGKTRVAEMVETVQGFYGLPVPGESQEHKRQVPTELKERLERKLNGEEEHNDAA